MAYHYTFDEIQRTDGDTLNDLAHRINAAAGVRRIAGVIRSADNPAGEGDSGVYELVVESRLSMLARLRHLPVRLRALVRFFRDSRDHYRRFLELERDLERNFGPASRFRHFRQP